MRGKDLTGRRFGRLVAVAPTAQRHRSCIVWRCRCDCGKEALVPTDWLLSGIKRSCGCLQDENRRRDLTGERRGKLTAIRRTGDIDHGSTVWEWRCDCGRTVIASAAYVDHARMCPDCVRSLKARQAREMVAGIKRTETGASEGQVRGILDGRLARNNSSGVRGVSWHRRVGKWQARIHKDGKVTFVGYFDRLEDAKRAREDAVQKLYKEPEA